MTNDFPTVQSAVESEFVMQTIIEDRELTLIHIGTRVVPQMLRVGALLFAIGVVLAIALVIVRKRQSSSNGSGEMGGLRRLYRCYFKPKGNRLLVTSVQ